MTVLVFSEREMWLGDRDVDGSTTLMSVVLKYGVGSRLDLSGIG
jgi:hypothetical protein